MSWICFKLMRASAVQNSDTFKLNPKARIRNKVNFLCVAELKTYKNTNYPTDEPLKKELIGQQKQPTYILFVAALKCQNHIWQEEHSLYPFHMWPVPFQIPVRRAHHNYHVYFSYQVSLTVVPAAATSHFIHLIMTHLFYPQTAPGELKVPSENMTTNEI